MPLDKFHSNIKLLKVDVIEGKVEVLREINSELNGRAFRVLKI